jgi:hypothetical protein
METINYKDHEIKIEQEDGGDFNPREWDNLGTMVCFHGRYELGDKHNLSVEEAKDILDRKDVVALPLYLYDHSGITISCKPFSCPWDSGQVGFIYADYEKIKKEFSTKRVGPVLREKVRKILIGEVGIYDQYLRGDVYYCRIEKDGEVIDSLGGIFGYDEAVKQAEYHIERDIKDRLKKHLGKLKTQIQNKVPLQYREALKV